MLIFLFISHKNYRHCCVRLLLKWFIDCITIFLCDERYLKAIHIESLTRRIKRSKLVWIMLLCRHTSDEISIEQIYLMFNCKKNSLKYEYLSTNLISKDIFWFLARRWVCLTISVAKDSYSEIRYRGARHESSLDKGGIRFLVWDALCFQ